MGWWGGGTVVRWYGGTGRSSSYAALHRRATSHRRAALHRHTPVLCIHVTEQLTNGLDRKDDDGGPEAVREQNSLHSNFDEYYKSTKTTCDCARMKILLLKNENKPYCLLLLGDNLNRLLDWEFIFVSCTATCRWLSQSDVASEHLPETGLSSVAQLFSCRTHTYGRAHAHTLTHPKRTHAHTHSRTHACAHSSPLLWHRPQPL